MKRTTSLALILLMSLGIKAQKPLYDGTGRLKAYQQQLAMEQRDSMADLEWQFLGPTNISGRCTDVAVVQPKGENYTIYAATASGGVWRSFNEGTSWEPIFEEAPSSYIGDIAIDPNIEEMIWVGTGEANIFRSNLAGCGIYRSTDRGDTWTHMGLEETHTIARIVIHPENPEIVYVAASGHEYTPNKERGVYRTTDGGESWEKILYISDMTGAIDLVMHPGDPDILYAATWQRIRKKWNDPRNEPGYDESGIYKTKDGGESWSPVNKGLPDASKRGRIGIDIARSNPDVLYAFVDNYEVARKAQEGEFDSYGRAKYDIIRGATVYRTDNGAEEWYKVCPLDEEMEKYMERHSGTYGWVFGQVRVDPNDEDKVYTMGLALNVSTDGGRSFKAIGDMHGDHHGLWIDPRNSDYMVNANDGGISVTYDGGKEWRSFTDNLPAVQFFNVAYDMGDPIRVYGSIQDHGSRRGIIDLSRGRDQIPAVAFEWAFGGEGCSHAIDPRNPDLVYSASFYGRMMRTDYSKKTEESTEVIMPVVYEDQPPLRGQWVAPFQFSPHNPDIVYLGMQYLFRSKDRGQTWERISGDLSYNDPDKKGDITYQTIYTLSESPLKYGLIYAGTDDGRLHVTKDEGQSWTEISRGLARGRWMSEVVASKYSMSRLYLTQSGKRDDDFAAYAWVSEDYGANWEDISSQVPLGPVNVIREDPLKENILYLGTETGVYVSLDRGKHWQVLGDLASVPVHDLVIHPRENLIIVATHGRGLYVMDADPVNGGRKEDSFWYW